ncbi:MAG: hypothetical protein A3I29_04090 [Candidatus Magasanikbacteria bacterium RIFCSPLOWO2_02_FULL_44_11]|uniref:Glycosyltransferase 2-like domain-containing protein n=2 Tax=Candidatus Magasanikiibacteriota TaxID=1752731 RepID=A0A1F6N9J5_9BACT|nr:MAG: hypothetical protein A3D53_02895 [Candidatus Magasanikbacteria bacterium RIFCSPHIGHO2_02_FULL_45_10]OGH80594.1 MAG: hypothetical protein A3I29_04090 [Candidatus Magasanikbacteria bacterium RIFCSPLOWO2_02_FULL_44_11]
MDRPILAVVMPVYNEAAIIASVVDQWTSELEKLALDFQLHIYNDGSKDGTLAILNEIANKNPRLIVHHKTNSGHGPTILQAYRENSTTPWLFQTDSDNEMPASEFHKLWNKRNEYDFLIGSRHHRAQSLGRSLVSFISRVVVWFFYGKSIKDVNSPYRLMRTEKFKSIFASMSSLTLTPNLIVTGMVRQLGMRYFEIAIDHEVRKTGKATATWRIFEMACKAFTQVIIFRFTYVR